MTKDRELRHQIEELKREADKRERTLRLVLAERAEEKAEMKRLKRENMFLQAAEQSHPFASQLLDAALERAVLPASAMKDAPIVPMTEDEQLLARQNAQAFDSKMLGEGRREYGPLNLDTDTRSVDELLAEALDELKDGTFYLLAAIEKLRRGST